MSTRPKPTGKQMIMQQVMLALVVFLGFQLMCNKPSGPQDLKGLATTASSTTINTKTTLNENRSGEVIRITLGTGAGEARVIKSHTLGANSVITVDPPWTVVPDGSSNYVISAQRTAKMLLGDPTDPLAGAPPTPAAGEPWDMTKASLYWANASLLDSTAAEINKNLQSEIDAEENAKQLTKDEAQALRVQGVIVLADTQYKAGKVRNEIGRTRLAFQSLQGWERSLQGTPLWTQTFPLPPSATAPERFAWREWSGKTLLDTLKSDLSALNKKDLIYGVFPGYEIIDFLVRLTGSNPDFSYAFAALLLAICVRAIIFPLAQKQLMWGRKMQQLQPLVKEIKEQYTDKKTKQVTNQAELQQKTMALYAEYGINPLAGCLPALVQFPLFITVYQFMLHYQFEFAKGHFLWINPGTSSATHGFFAPNLGVIDRPLIVFYGITMVTSTLLMPVSDPSQVKQQRIMGVGIGLMMTVFMFLGMFPVPGAFVLYWTFTNLLATAQSLRAYRMPLPPLEKVNTKAGGVFPMPPFKDGGGGSLVNGKPNGKPTGPVIAPKTTTGTPAKHKPKKRK